jgi:hypothetical protein
MTPAEIRAAHEARKTLPPRLLDPALNAAALRWYESALNQARRDLIEEQREAQREVRDAVAEERWRANQGEDYGSW